MRCNLKESIVIKYATPGDENSDIIFEVDGELFNGAPMPKEDKFFHDCVFEYLNGFLMGIFEDRLSISAFAQLHLKQRANARLFNSDRGIGLVVMNEDSIKDLAKKVLEEKLKIVRSEEFDFGKTIGYLATEAE